MLASKKRIKAMWLRSSPESALHAVRKLARRAAKRVGLMAHESRWRRDSVDNYGGFALVAPNTNGIVAGVRFGMTPDEVIEYCA